MKYRAIVSITFNSEDLREVTDIHGTMDPTEVISAELDGLSIGTAFVEQVYENGEEMIYRSSGGMMVEVSEHDLEDIDENRYEEEEE